MADSELLFTIQKLIQLRLNLYLYYYTPCCSLSYYSNEPDLYFISSDCQFYFKIELKPYRH